MAKACCSCLQLLNYHKLITRGALNLHKAGVVTKVSSLILNFSRADTIEAETKT